MGRRKKKNYQSLNEIQEDNAMRMASEAITEEDVIQALGENVLSELRGEVREDALIQEAMDYLPKRRAELSLMAPSNHGGIFTESRKDMSQARFNQMLNHMNKAEGALSELGTLRGSVPAPIIRRLDNGTVRTHVEFEDNDITGQRQVVPFMDPSNPTQVLKTRYGQAGIDSEAGHQGEPAMMNAMKLQGYDVNYHDPEFAPGKTKGLADLQGLKDGKSKNVDVMIKNGNQLQIPLYTYLQVPGDKVFKGDVNQGSVYKAVKELINSQLIKQNDKDYINAVETLIANGKLTPNHESRAGKLLRADRSFMGNEAYDGLIVPKYNAEAMKERKYSPKAPANVPIAPDSINEVNLKIALDMLKTNGSKGASIIPNYGSNKARNKSERAIVKQSIPMNESYGVSDATIKNPLLQQLLSTKAMNQRLV